ncbi:hypothetical protein M6B22_06800 [Jatrophihabitans cynanchi]|uniref:Uncharacterized protein n=1 Tax=Jatrophihabitans cynanchi TaxID=2944128 RepID=A0ABY7K0T7_9ACTN|nr:hypothetical protein [Jatrophihabitans sp. SB3-54]WAX58466.1 hypothetical protein M6B22_06800 [Jatrophihabitans sp. SB3-54]
MTRDALPPPQARGLDLSDLDHVTADEIAAFQEHYIRLQGRPHAGFDFFLANNPSAVKRYRLFAAQTAVPFDRWLPLTATNFANIAWYARTGYLEGIRYIVHIQQTSGHSTKDEVFEGLAISLYHAGAQGGEVIATALRDYQWQEPSDSADRGGWQQGRALLASGLDFSEPRLLPGELERLEDWYRAALGQVPGYVRFLGRHRPDALKAWRNRYENLVSTLPAQLLPLAAIKVSTYAVNTELLRENVLLARYLGASKEDTLITAMSGLLYGQMEAAEMLECVVGDVFDDWDGRIGEGR